MHTRTRSRGAELAYLAIVASLLSVMAVAPAHAQCRSDHPRSSPPRADGRLAGPPMRCHAQVSSQPEGKKHDARYNVITIGVLPGKTNTYVSEFRGVNNLGDVTGYSYVYTGDINTLFSTSQGFIWHNGRLNSLGLLNGYQGAFAFAINDRGQVAGNANYVDAAGNVFQTAVRWDHGQPVNLGTLEPNSISYALGINIFGVAVGVSAVVEEDVDTRLPVVWSGGTVRGLPLFSGEAGGVANQINDLGLIVGYQFSDTNEIPCLWYWNGGGYTAVNLGNFGGDLGEANGINDLGQIVGWSAYVGDTSDAAFLWNWRGMVALPSLPGDTGGQGNGINELGQIVGFSQLFDDHGNFISERAVIWEHGLPTELHSLVPPSTPPFTAIGNITDLGEIAADSGDLLDGTVAGYLLVPGH